ncbi:AI-2E family transporter YdiK [Pantoea ananatis]
MKSLERQIDLPQMLFTLIFILLLIAACLWVVQPFILGFAWASMVVYCHLAPDAEDTAPAVGRRSLAVIVMTILLLLLFIIPVALLVNSLIDNSAPVIAWATQGHMLPTLSWLNDIPMVGEKLYASYQKLVAGGGAAIMAKLQPYVGRTTGFFVAQAGHFGRFMIHLAVMLLFSVLLYWRGEQAAQGIRHFAWRMAGRRGDAAVLLAGQAVRAVALGVVVTALVQGVLGGIGLAVSGIPYATLLTVLMILCCLVQIGPRWCWCPRLFISTGVETPPGARYC